MNEVRETTIDQWVPEWLAEERYPPIASGEILRKAFLASLGISQCRREQIWTGDADAIILHSFRGISNLTPHDFVAQFGGGS